MLTALILVACMVLVVVLLGLPLLLRPDSPIPDVIGFGILAAWILFCVWTVALWWVLIPVLGLVGLAVWLDRERPGARAAATLDGRGMSARTRQRFRLWRVANVTILALGASVFFLPAGSAGGLILPGLMIAMVAVALFRFSFYRSWRRDAHLSDEPGLA